MFSVKKITRKMFASPIVAGNFASWWTWCPRLTAVDMFTAQAIRLTFARLASNGQIAPSRHGTKCQVSSTWYPSPK